VNVPQYDVAALRRALAEDPRTAELGVHVRIRGDHLFLSGDVACEQRRAAVAEVAAEHADGLLLHNEVHIVRAEPPTEQEDLR
jgi:hypothetical protein